MASRIQRELAFLLTGRDVSASKAMKGVEGNISALTRHSRKAATNIGQNIERGVLIGTTAAAGAIGYAVKQAIDWESAWAGVRKTVEGTPEELAAIEQGIRDMSKRMPVSAEELAAIAESAGALGIATPDVLAFTETVAMIGATTDVTTDQAATALGQLQNVIGLTGDDFDNFAAALVQLGNDGASTESQILEIARRAGGAADLIGVAKEQTLGWASAAANLGINQELAGTSLQSFFQKALLGVNGGGKKLELFAKTAGTTAAKFKKAFAKDATGALQSFLKGLGKIPKEQRLKIIQELFGKGTGLTRLINGLADSFDRNLAPSIETSTKAWEDNKAAQEEYEKRVQTTAAQLQILQNNVNDAAVTIGTALLPVINDLAKEGVDWLTDNQDEIAQFAEDLADGVRDAVEWAKTLDWDGIANALKSGAGFAADLVGAFASAPAWLQQFLVMGFVANKFTGGVVTDLVKDVISTALKGSLGINAAVVNVNGGVVNGGGIGVGGKGPAAFGGNFASTIAKGVAGGLLAAGGSALLSQGASMGANQWGYGAGIGGAGMMIAGGAAMFGPLGAIAASIAAVVQTQQQVSGQNTAMAAGIKQSLDTNLPKMSTEELKSALGGVQQGIQDLQSNPLYTLVQGDALTSLQAMERDLKAQLAPEQTKGWAAGREAWSDPSTALGKAITPLQDDTRSEGIATRKAIDDSKAKTQENVIATRLARDAARDGATNVASATRAGAATGAIATSAGASRIVGAIAANRPITSVTTNVYVTSGSVTSKQTTDTRYGGATGGSRTADGYNDSGR